MSITENTPVFPCRRAECRQRKTINGGGICTKCLDLLRSRFFREFHPNRDADRLAWHDKVWLYLESPEYLEARREMLEADEEVA